MTEKEKSELVNEICERTNDYTRNMINNIPKSKEIESIRNMVMLVVSQNKEILKSQEQIQLKLKTDDKFTFKKILKWASIFVIVVMTISNTLFN
ncbi:MAG: hypothetical protein WC389_03670 [Lutibacter sp.]|jgi:hypothetical protein